MTLQGKLEWALMTIREKLVFGLDEAEGIKRRESRCRGVLIDAVKELPIIEKNLAEAKERVKELETANGKLIKVVGSCIEMMEIVKKGTERLNVLPLIKGTFTPEIESYEEFIQALKDVIKENAC